MPQGIKNIIFDLGGVLLNIDYHKTIRAFQNLGINNFEEMYSQRTADKLFEDLETGKISEEEFYKRIIDLTNGQVTDVQIKTAWNTILLDFRPKSIAFLEKLAVSHKLYLLSNTNIIHQKAFEKLAAETLGGKRLNDYFITAYYSHRVHLRKPHTEIYAFVLNDAGIKAAETLFIDDSEINMTAPKQLGIHTHLLLPGETIEEIIPGLIG
jgi:HAD superfamily hydrolase (TIGR01509 family)